MRAHFPTLCVGYVDLFTGLSPSFFIGQSNYFGFGFGFTTLHWNLLYAATVSFISLRLSTEFFAGEKNWSMKKREKKGCYKWHSSYRPTA